MLTKLRVIISTKIFIIYKIHYVTFNMKPKITFVAINRVFFITNDRNADLHGKVITVGGNFGKQLASYLQVTSFESCYSYGLCFVLEALTFLI